MDGHLPVTNPSTHVTSAPDPHVDNVGLSNPRAFSPDRRVTHIRNNPGLERESDPLVMLAGDGARQRPNPIIRAESPASRIGPVY